MKSKLNLVTVLVCLFGTFLFIRNNVYSQGNNNGNANTNNNANTNAVKWEMHGNNGNNADNTHFIGTTNPTALKMRTNNTERLKITKDGNIGIGISNPLEKFEIQGNIKLSGDLIFSNYANDTTDKFLFVDLNGRTHTKTILEMQEMLYERTRISQCDRYVDGIPNPTWSNGTNKIYSECAQVRIGIGTSSPQKSLDVRGTTQTRRLEIGRESSGGSLISGFRTSVSNSPVLSLGNFNPQSETEHVALELMSSGELNLTYNEFQQGSTGKVLTIKSIGENRKLLQLENNGMLRARRVKIDLDNWADFVFEENYQLMPLGELRNYVQTNKHLPNVPSEEKLQEEGLDLAEMNKILMQKVEELTLYLLDQNETTEKLQKEVEELKQKIAK